MVKPREVGAATERRAHAEVAAITVAAMLVASAGAWLGLGATMGLPPIGGVFLLTAAVALRRKRTLLRVVSAAVLAGAAAFAVDWFVLFVLGAGHLELRELRKGPAYAAAMVLLFVWPALTDTR